VQASISDSLAVIVPTDATGSLFHCASKDKRSIDSSGIDVKGGVVASAVAASEKEEDDKEESREISDAEEEDVRSGGRNGDRQRDPTESPRRKRGIGALLGL